MKTWIVQATLGDEPGLVYTSVTRPDREVHPESVGEPAKMASYCDEHGWEYTFMVAIEAPSQREAALGGMSVLVDAFPDDFGRGTEAEVVGEYTIPAGGAYHA